MDFPCNRMMLIFICNKDLPLKHILITLKSEKMQVLKTSMTLGTFGYHAEQLPAILNRKVLAKFKAHF